MKKYSVYTQPKKSKNAKITKRWYYSAHCHSGWVISSLWFLWFL